MVALSVLMVIGMMAACGGGAGGGDGSGSGDSYSLKYGNIVIYEDAFDDPSDLTEYGFSSSTDFSVSGKVITLNDAGFEKFLAIMEEEEGNPVVAIVTYNDQMIMPVTQDMFDFFAAGLDEGTDYTLAANGKIVQLTDDGYQKGGELFSEYE
ncbi:MAG: hypothetical protein IKR64_03670 [Treponema sp.]|nr:hypothetical protein [Treponema sp.]